MNNNNNYKRKPKTTKAQKLVYLQKVREAMLHYNTNNNAKRS